MNIEDYGWHVSFSLESEGKLAKHHIKKYYLSCLTEEEFYNLVIDSLGWFSLTHNGKLVSNESIPLKYKKIVDSAYEHIKCQRYL